MITLKLTIMCLAIMSATVPLVWSAVVPQPVQCKDSPCPAGSFCGGGPQLDFWYCKPCSSICDARRTQSNDLCQQEPTCASFRERSGTEPAAVSESTSSTTSANAGALPVAISAGTAEQWKVIIAFRTIVAIVAVTIAIGLVCILRKFCCDRRNRIRQKVCPFNIRPTMDDNATTSTTTTTTTTSNIGSADDTVDEKLPIQEMGGLPQQASTASNDRGLNDETEPLSVNMEQEARQQNM